MSQSNVLARIAHRFGPVDAATGERITVAAKRGLDSGLVLTDDLGQLSSSVLGPNYSGTIRTAGGISIGALSDVLAGASDILANQPGSFADEPLDWRHFAYLEDLYGDNPEAWRALAVGMITGTVKSSDIRLDLQLSGGETWKEIVERAINWRLLMEHNYTDRFEDLEEEEIIDLSLRVIAGWRKW